MVNACNSPDAISSLTQAYTILWRLSIAKPSKASLVSLAINLPSLPLTSTVASGMWLAIKSWICCGVMRVTGEKFDQIILQRAKGNTMKKLILLPLLISFGLTPALAADEAERAAQAISDWVPVFAGMTE